MMLVRHRQVDDGQHHENEGLQGDHQQVEDRPRQGKHELDNQEDPTAGMRQLLDTLECQHGQQQENHLAGEQVAVQAQRQGNRARQEGNNLEDQVDGDQDNPSTTRLLEVNGCSVNSARKPPRPFMTML